MQISGEVGPEQLLALQPRNIYFEHLNHEEWVVRKLPCFLMSMSVDPFNAVPPPPALFQD